MSKDKGLEDSMRRRRPPRDIEEEVASTIFGDAANEAQLGKPIEVSQIADSAFQSRVKLDLDHVEMLVALIQKGGLLSPILVRPVEGGDKPYELVAGHHRLEAFKRLKQTTIPAIVRRLSNAQAARALTAENTARKGLSDWELYKHMVMLQEQDAVQNKTELAEVMSVSRTQIYNLEAFASLPESVHPLLNESPEIIGAGLVYALKPLLDDPVKGESAKLLVEEAFRLIEAKKLKQTGVKGWIERKLEGPVASSKKEYAFKEEGLNIKVVLGPSSAKISGEFDSEKLHKLIQDNLAMLRKA
ncbi:ParB/RepB/Spo0J family partition protein [Massilia aerilata]|uniref:ParB/RepB/Spo0J family partition protein n=1 Tax=Massilia aerilata TaxID=453817 RepID=A0ABW0S3G6_9BURK